MGRGVEIKNSAKNLEPWFEGIQIPIRSDQTVSSTEIAYGKRFPSFDNPVIPQLFQGDGNERGDRIILKDQIIILWSD
ncbi:hypothetical protein NIES932_14570 [Raphidiopsis curvata NIES-932]|nr:hypothetical protein NIES932_14510 [Raphidiopsis curvata NIES-932]BAZ89972.1 hypothetical protein NIES932_14570 [Raphidiopsis curvata NIES-932]